MGILAGTALGFGMVYYSDADGNAVPKVPWLLAIIMLLAAILLGVIASILPARRAGKLSVLTALTGKFEVVRKRNRLSWVAAVLVPVGLAFAVFPIYKLITLPYSYEDFYQATFTYGLVFAWGIILFVLGILATIPFLLTLVGKAARILGISGRIAVRDLDRQRHRSASTVAALVGVICAITTAMVGMNVDLTVQEERSSLMAAPGDILLGYGGESGTARDRHGNLLPVSQTQLDRIHEQLNMTRNLIDQQYGIASIIPINGVSYDRIVNVGAEKARFDISVEFPEERLCPADKYAEEFYKNNPNAEYLPDEAKYESYPDDPRCKETAGMVTGYVAPWDYPAVLIDDTTLLRETGQYSDTWLTEAKKVLGQGGIVIDSADYIVDGKVTVETKLIFVNDDDRSEIPPGSEQKEPKEEVLATLTVPAIATPADIDNSVIIASADTVVKLKGKVASLGEIIVPKSKPGSYSGYQLGNQIRDQYSEVAFHVATPSIANIFVPLICLAFALLVGIGAIAGVVALAGAETRTDLDTLEAVGASPVIRWRFNAWQGAAVGVAAVVPGIVAGLVAGILVSIWNIGIVNRLPDVMQYMVIPWGWLLILLIAVPLAGMICGVAFGPRRRRRMKRRID